MSNEGGKRKQNKKEKKETVLIAVGFQLLYYTFLGLWSTTKARTHTRLILAYFFCGWFLVGVQFQGSMAVELRKLAAFYTPTHTRLFGWPTWLTVLWGFYRIVQGDTTKMLTAAKLGPVNGFFRVFVVWCHETPTKGWNMVETIFEVDCIAGLFLDF